MNLIENLVWPSRECDVTRFLHNEFGVVAHDTSYINTNLMTWKLPGSPIGKKNDIHCLRRAMSNVFGIIKAFL